MKKISLFLLLFLLTISSHGASTQRRATPTSVHTVGAKLFETDLYELYEYGFRWCDNRNNAAVSIVFKADTNLIITDDDAYKRRFEKEILPVIKQRCTPVTRVSVFHYIKGIRIDRQLKEYRENDQAFPGYEQPLSVIRIDLDSQGGVRYQRLGSRTSMADLRKEREERERQEAQRQAAAEAAEHARMAAERADQQRQAERDRIESKGGIEPTSKELAVGFTNFIKTGTPTCPRLENMEFCEWAPSVVIRLKGGEKDACQAVLAGRDYHCRYSVEFECAFINPRTGEPDRNPITKSLYCSMWGKNTYTTGVRKLYDQWVVYRLDNEKGQDLLASVPANPPRPPGEDNLRASADTGPCSRPSAQVFTMNDQVDTGITVKRGDRITIRASGQVTFGAFAGSGGPQGISFNPIYNLVKDYPHGSLIGRVKRAAGADAWTYIGNGIVVISQVDGVLQLAVNDKEPLNNRDQFRVEVSVCAAR